MSAGSRPAFLVHVVGDRRSERLHHYHFQLHALDVDTLGLPAGATASDVVRALQGHVLATAEHVGTCTLNRRLRAAT